MRVLQINATYGYASTGIIVKDISDMLSKNGHEAFYAYQSRMGASGNGYRIGNKIDWKLHALFCRLFGKQGYYSRHATKGLIKHIEKIKPDIVHLHNLHSNYVHLNLLLNYLGKKDIATVITLHDCWYFTGKCFHYIDVGCQRFTIGCGNCVKKKAPPKSLFFDVSKKVLRDRYKYLSKIPRLQIVGCSDWICSEAKKSILKDFNITRIYNGVDIEVFKPYKQNELKEKYDGNCMYIMGMANKWLLPENKSFFDAVLEILTDERKLILIGCRENQIEGLKALSKNIIPVDFIRNREVLAKYYSMVDVFVNVTHADTLPTVNMESICCGTPVLTYDSCGSPELILKGCGKVEKENNIEGVISDLKQGFRKIDTYVLEQARAKYNKDVCYKEYLSMYQSVLEKKG